MLNKKYLLLIAVLSIVITLNFVSPYTAPTYNSVNFSLCTGYTAPTYDSVNFTLSLDDSCITDTCTAPGSGNWDVDCNDNCTVSTSTDIDGDLILYNSGIFTLTNQLNFVGSGQEIIVETGCEIRIESGGGVF